MTNGHHRSLITYMYMYIHQGIFELYVEVFIPGALEVLDAGGGDEALQAVQPHLGPLNLTLLHLRKEVHKLVEVAAPVIRLGSLRLL